jgi:hypothetical protein
MINVGAAAGDGQVVQDGPSVSLQRVEQPGGALLPFRPAPPGGGIGLGQELAEAGVDLGTSRSLTS